MKDQGAAQFAHIELNGEDREMQRGNCEGVCSVGGARVPGSLRDLIRDRKLAKLGSSKWMYKSPRTCKGHSCSGMDDSILSISVTNLPCCFGRQPWRP